MVTTPINHSQCTTNPIPIDLVDNDQIVHKYSKIGETIIYAVDINIHA